ncbi:MAG: helix-turn-helix domain-containing protein [Bacteroidales bacterium]|nr:helix-turn-helix domain-containing protein [Bacteroidales bacterium]
MKEIMKINNISDIHSFFDIDKPKHPLVSVFKHEEMKMNKDFVGVQYILDLYQVTYKMCSEGSFGYGRNTYDFREGTMIFTRPGQVLTMHEWEADDAAGGWSILFHPDLIRKSELGKNIDQYTFFSYDVHEALHLSEDEKITLFELAKKIEKEYNQNIDKHTQKLIVSNIELVLDYCTRYYDRQFYTRSNMNKDLVSRFDKLLRDYYESGKPLETGVPSVAYCGAEMNMSSNYLSDMLKKETGRNAQEHIHFFVVDKAKTQLLSTGESISQVAYGLGFDYPQHFSKVFKKKTGMSPAEYRNVN